jgi:hypothetical protein
MKTLRALLVTCLGAALLGAGGVASAAHVETYTAPLPVGAWKPTLRELVNALDVLKHDAGIWEQKTGRELRVFDKYRFQYYGIRAKGRRLVVLNAFCSQHWERAPEWRTRLVAVEGGGSCFFQAKIDAESWAIVDLVVNDEGEPAGWR